MIAVFARADHPKGWGMPEGRAHGYVTLFVRCEDDTELEDVRERLRRYPGWSGVGDDTDGYWHGRLDPGYSWFGGQFDFVGSLPCETVELPHALERGPGGDADRFLCVGDNRFIGFYEAAEVLAS